MKKKQKKKSRDNYKIHSRKYVEKMVIDFVNKNQIVAYFGKDVQGIFEVRFRVKEPR